MFEIPNSPQTLPSGHTKHSELSFNPLSMLNVPLGHVSHTLEAPADLNVPGGHIVGQDVLVPLHWFPLGHFKHA